MKTIDIAWVAGILEGEGCFLFSNSPTIRLGMTDRDIVTRVRDIMIPNKEVYAFESHGNIPGWKQRYTLNLHGIIAIQWMMTIYPLMGSRRKAKIKDVITTWKSMRNKQVGSDERTH